MRVRVKKHYRRWFLAAAGAFALGPALAACTPLQQTGYLPSDDTVTNHTGVIIDTWVNAWIVLMLIGILVWGLIIWASIVYRRRRGQTALPKQTRYNLPIETFFTFVPLVLILGMFAFTAREQAVIESRWDEPDVVVEIQAKRWAWDFNYKTEDGGHYFAGIQTQLKEGNTEPDPATIPEIVLPVGQKVELQIKSRDVVHSVWIVEHLYKKDAIPGHTNYYSFIPNKEGVFTGKCAELCGEYHPYMLFTLRVVPLAEYEAYVQSLPAGQLGDEANPQYD
ncbi:MAG: cytochrome c oxidase subunit II [Microbacteriaceae bacterium]|nr:cytochrome c oxidase subunit II [Microbacteriaceae bacterium]